MHKPLREALSNRWVVGGICLVVWFSFVQVWNFDVGLKRDGYHVRFLRHLTDWGWSEWWSDGAQIVNHRRFYEHGYVRGFLEYYHGGWYLVHE